MTNKGNNLEEELREPRTENNTNFPNPSFKSEAEETVIIIKLDKTHFFKKAFSLSKTSSKKPNIEIQPAQN